MSNSGKILTLTLKKQWFDMINSGIKTEEYREIKQFWISRLCECKGKNNPEKTGFYCQKANCISCLTRSNGLHPINFGLVEFKNGYNKTAPTCLFEVEKISIGKGNPEWGGSDDDVFIITLGKKYFNKNL